MMLFGHMGITLGTAVLLDKTISKSHTSITHPDQPITQVNQTRSSLLSRIDLRILLIGSLLPDIIDKPVGDFLFRETFNNGRIFSHTLLFLLLITLAGFYIHHRYRKTWLLVLSFGTFMHLLLDQMWLEPSTLLWPIYGFGFDKSEITNVLDYWLHHIHTKPSVYIPEIIGFLILGWFLLKLVHDKKVHSFIRRGEI